MELIISSLILMVTFGLWFGTEFSTGEGHSAWRALRLSAFNTVSIVTGTGYATADYNAWGSFAVAAFFAFMFIGGCAGSTACSIKIFRYQVAFEGLRAYPIVYVGIGHINRLVWRGNRRCECRSWAR